MFLKAGKMAVKNIPARTASPVSNALMTAAGCAVNPVYYPVHLKKTDPCIRLSVKK